MPEPDPVVGKVEAPGIREKAGTNDGLVKEHTEVKEICNKKISRIYAYQIIQ